MLKRYTLIDNQVEETEGAQAPILLFINPDEAERRHLIDDLKINERLLNAALDADSVARFSHGSEHLAMVLKRPKNYSSKEQFFFKVASVGIFLFKERVVVILSEDVPVFTGRFFQHISSLPDLFLRAIGRTIYHFQEHLKVINMITDNLEQKINSSSENKYLLNLFSLKKSLIYYSDAIHANAMLMEKTRHNADKLGLDQENLKLLEDLVMENKQCGRLAETNSKILVGLTNVRSLIVSNNLSLMVKALNILIISSMVPCLVLGLFFLNTVLMVKQMHAAVFWLITSLAAIATLLAILVWKRCIKRFDS